MYLKPFSILKFLLFNNNAKLYLKNINYIMFYSFSNNIPNLLQRNS